MNDEFRYKTELLQAFLALECVRPRHNRDTFVAELEQELGHPLSFRRDDEARFDIWALLGACLAAPEEGALDRLVTIIRTFEGDSKPMIRIVALVGQPSPLPLPAPGQASLSQILESMDRSELAAATRAASGPLGPRSDLSAGDPAGIVGALAYSAAMPDGPPPMLAFLLELAGHHHGPLADDLYVWVNRVAERLHIPTEDLDRIRARMASGRPPVQRSFVVVELREDGPRPDRYLLAVWLQHDDGNGRALYVNDDRPLRLDELPDQLAAVLNGLQQEGVEEIGEVTVEFVLPRHLLGHTVDQWPVTFVGPSHEIGIAFPVVVRSLDRIRNLMMRPRWERRWRQISKHGWTAKAELVHWLRHDEVDHGIALAKVLTLGDESPVCLVVPFSPGSKATPMAIAAGLDAGVPVMLWCRDPRGAAQFEADVPHHMYARGLMDLPALVLRLRQDAVRLGQTEDHVGRHVSLLWDDPDRLPPEIGLRAPTPV